MMNSTEDEYKEFQESLHHMKGHFHVLETSVPIEKQMEYFQFAEKIRKHPKLTTEEATLLLEVPDTSTEKMKLALTTLAISGEVKAYRILEDYQNHPREELEDWSKMAFLQAKITLESEFTNEKQIFISTGLGGKEDKIRFFSFFKSKTLIPFSSYQIQLIEKEIPFFIEEEKGLVEELNIFENYFTLLFLIDLRADIKYLLEKAVDECNQYGDFIDSRFTISNVKIMDQKDINKELGKPNE